MKNKFKKLVFLGSLAVMAFAGNLHAQSQLSRWHAAPNVYDVTTAPPGVSTFATSANAYNKEYNSICDNSGNIIFYIANGVIYNKLHNSIGTLPPLFSHTEVAIVPNPNNFTSPCHEKYFIIYPKQSSLTGSMDYGEVDMTANSGAGQFTTIGSIPASIGQPGANPLAVSRVNASGNRFLYFHGAGVNNLPVCQITSTGISAPIGSAYTSTITGCVEMELSNAGDMLAFSRQSSANYELILVPLNPVTGLPSGAPVTYNTGAGVINGLEFDNSGSRIFFSKGGASGGVFYQNTGSTAYSPYPVAATAFGNGMLEKGFNGNEILCASSSHLGSINTTSTSLNFTQVATTLPAVNTGFSSSLTYLMPDQIDGENYNASISVLYPSFTTNAPYCGNSPIAVDGSASYGTLNSITVPGIIGWHVWLIAEYDITTNTIVGSDWWGTFTNGNPGPYSFPPVSSGGPSLQCGKYYRVKLAVGNCDVPWAENSQIIFINCPPNANAGPDMTICSGDCVEITELGTPRRNHSFHWYDLSYVGPGSSIVVCPTQNTQYCVTVTNNLTTCSATDCMNVTVETADPDFSVTANTTNNAYLQLSATPNQTTNLPAGFGFMWFVDELDASFNTVYSVNSSNPGLTPCWWTFPGAEVFDGFDGLTYTLNNACLPNPGKFKYNVPYRITRGVWSDNCGWRQSSLLLMYTKSTNPQIVFIEDPNAPDMSSYMSTANVSLETESKTMFVFPNPASDILNVEVKNLQAGAKLVICDLTGRAVKTVQVQNASGEIQLDISEMINGSYLVFLYEGDALIGSQKIMVTK